jgi:glycosyltransferase 2 family protein
LPVALYAGWLLAGGPFWPAWIGLPLSVFARRVARSGILAQQVAMQIAAVLTVGATLWILAGAMGAALPLLEAIAFAPVALLATVSPFIFVGLGAREAVFAVGLPLVVPITPESSVALNLGFGACLLIASLPGALALPPILNAQVKRHAVQ